MIDRNCERPLEANEEPSQETNRRQSAGSVSDSSAATPENAWQTDPYADVPHPADSPEAEERDLHEIQVAGELSKMLVREEARIRFNARKSADTIQQIPQPVSLTEFLATPDEPLDYRIEGLFPVGGRIMLSAQYKAGKTTTVGNLVRSLVDGDDFLGRFQAHPVQRVTLIDNESDNRRLRSWFRDFAVQNTHAVAVQCLRGAVGTFNILDADVRTRWAEILRGTDFLILDVLRPVLDALGLDENHDAGRFLVAFDALLKEAGIAEAAVIHHMGHSGERSRGDSRLQDWPDAIWKIVRQQSDDPTSPRFFSAFGRDVNVSEGSLTFDEQTRHLTYMSGDTRKNAAASAAVLSARPDVIRFLTISPGSSRNTIVDALTKDPGHPQKVTREAIKACIDAGEVTFTPGPRNSHMHFVAPPQPSPLGENDDLEHAS